MKEQKEVMHKDNTLKRMEIGKRKHSKRESIFKNRDLDLENKIPIRIDYRTVVYAKPGSDIEAIKVKYARR